MLTGSIVALVTPMQLDGSVDWGALDRLIEWHIESGTHGIVPMGTTGESATLFVGDALLQQAHPRGFVSALQNDSGGYDSADCVVQRAAANGV